MKEYNSILLVDDEEDIRRVASLSLARVGGFAIQESSSGAEALKSLEQSLPDAIIVDMMMPGMDGLEFLDQMKKQFGSQAPPLIFMTAKVQPEERREYLEKGAVGVIAKPFNPVKLSEEVREILKTV